MKNITAFISLLLLSLTSCKKSKPPCEGAFNIKTQSEVVVTFIDKATGKYLYSETNPMYDKDSLKVFDNTGNSLIILKALRINAATYEEYWDLSFGTIYDELTDENSFNSEICKDYIVKYSLNEPDTIQVCFKSEKTKCGSKFDTIKVYHDGQEVGFATNTIGISVTILKD